MTYIEKIAYHLGRRDEVPNQELAALLAKEENIAGIDEIASYLNDKNKSIQSDCLKVLYEIGYIAPHLIAKYVDTFIELLDSKNNRMVWGSMIALGAIAEVEPLEIWPHREKIKQAMETGSVITNDGGAKILIYLSRAGNQYYDESIDDLMHLQKECRDKDCAKHAEAMWQVIHPMHREAYKSLLEERKPALSNAAQKRLAKVIKQLSEA